jgi:hypothetical protein
VPRFTNGFWRPRQRARAGATLAIAVSDLEERSSSGQSPRADGFFERPSDGRPPAEELLEGVLLHAANAYQERKVPFMGAFFTSVAFPSDISPAYAHLLLQAAEQLTYRQLVVLAYFTENENSRELTDLTARRETEGHWELADGLGPELNELGDRGLLGVRQANGGVISASGTWDGGVLSESSPGASRRPS